MKYHVPVLLNESIKGLSIKPEGIYVDLTFGGGGHSKLILEKLSNKGKLFSFDTDIDAIKNNSISQNNFELIQSNFKFFDNHLKSKGIEKVDGILADLGISSYQIDNLERGFSYKGDYLLDMRMSNEIQLSAEDVINDYEKSNLNNILFNYGDIKNSRFIVENLINYREKKRIKKNSDLIEILNKIFGKKVPFKFLSKFYQAIRIEVNDEINSLKEMLKKTINQLNTNGRLVILSYHSIEDRLVKNFINKSSFLSDYKKDLYGNKVEFFKKINKKPLTPSSEELKENPRSRSAKLRIGEKI
ncbi:MAG: 16S rRNA (cytosine(1402)-N(4))-methyltransferase [Cytophagia bacterium]|jgi:16S rRNA (cytosine1402-N4)-methyltransferase|nr:16S rRNA (cytosine(1402)-N(4))-methyltransferase [Cytophagia bacterium]|tara:strand:- start:1930 stop:2832 length:903 start_codon:yes stop_codon:yes gene_type:complete